MGSTLRPQSIQQKAAIGSRVEKDLWPKVLDGSINTHIEKVFLLNKMWKYNIKSKFRTLNNDY